MKVCNITLPKSYDRFGIVPLGDFHIGDEYCRMDLLKKTIDFIANNERIYTILNGDLINNAIKTSVSDTYRETMTIEQQQDFLIKLLMPIKDKILYMTQGNHESRTSTTAGIDPLRYVAKSLGLLETNRYSDNAYLLNINFGANKSSNAYNHYTIFGTHGCGSGGRRMGSTVNALEDMTKIIPNADLYIHSHTHTPITYSDKCFMATKNGMIPFSRTFVNTNAYVDYGGYAEKFGFKAVDMTPMLVTVSIGRYENRLIPITNVQKLSI